MTKSSGAHESAAAGGEFGCWSLLQELQHVLRSRVRLLQSCHAGLFQNVVLRHLRNRLADIGILDIVLGAGQVRKSPKNES